MTQAYDVFKEDDSGAPIWVERVVGLHQVKKRLMKLTSLKPAKYLVYDPTDAKFIELSKKSA
jgi:hypothetical protein